MDACRRSQVVMALAAALLATTPLDMYADVVRIEILSRQPANDGRAVGTVGEFEIVRGKIYGEIDPADPRNKIIQDLELAPRNERGKVEYVATFALAKPLDLTKAARVLLYQVVNRGNGQVTIGPEGYISLISGWQGDVVPTPNNQTIVVPVAKARDGRAVTGRVIARFIDVPKGVSTAPIRLASLGTPQPYLPADLSDRGAVMTMYSSESRSGAQQGQQTIARSDWAFANCEKTPFPGTPDPTRVCLREGFRADRAYQLLYATKDPLVLGVGLAATRDVVSFFRYAERDRSGTPNPVAGAIDRAVSIGDSQSGNFIRTFIHLGFNQDESNRIVWDGAFPRIAARQTPMNLRFALPGGAAGLYEPGSDGTVWWGPYRDRTRGLKPAGLLDRCTASKTCPKIIEAFGSAEFWGLRMSPDLIGTDAKSDIPLPDNVRRYYYPGTTHGGGRGGFRVEPGDLASFGGAQCELPQNPNPQADTTRALTRALVEWVTRDTAPPPSRYPTLANGDLVPATRAAIGLPDIPGLTFNDQILNPVLGYDFGPSFNAADVSGVMTTVPPPVRRVLPTYVPRVNRDGNETAGVASVLYQAPLGTYLGWNVIRTGFFAGQGCGFSGGYVPFARTKAERLAKNDPRLSLEERYGTQEGYLCVVRRAVEQAVTDRFLLPEDAQRLIAEATASKVLPVVTESSEENAAIGRALCAADSQ
jgi:Alpha/beta hydrolase domain